MKEWDAQWLWESLTSDYLWEMVTTKPLQDAKAEVAEHEAFRINIALRILKIMEEIYWVIDCPCPSLVWQVLAEELEPIISDYINKTKCTEHTNIELKKQK